MPCKAYIFVMLFDPGDHRRRPKTEEKAKVVSVGWGTYLNGALTIGVAACCMQQG